jgi:uncharacterized protein (TIGR03437 family)
MRRWRHFRNHWARLAALAASLLALSPAASAYYYWVYFAGDNAPFSPVPVKFDLTSLPDSQTVTYFISDQGPSPMMPGDSFQALVSEIRLAAQVWNRVSSSSLRLAFGGIESANTQQATPGIDIIFDDDMPPGLLAQSKPMTADNLSLVANGAAFVPIVRSTMQLRKDLTAYQQASYDDSFFLTIVHEFGHTLGLQHSLTGGVMATSLTRGTTKGNPLSADDVAGLSLLYPAPGFLAASGSISGVVLLDRTGVNLASVVAVSTSGATVGGMTNPDGSYRIDGIPPGQYYVYAHPLPPPAPGESSPDNIVPPEDLQKNPFLANTGFDTELFPGTRDWTQAMPISVTAGGVASGVNFSMQPRSGPAVYDGEVYAYQGAAQNPVQAPSLVSGTRNSVAFFAFGAVVNNSQLAQGLSVSVIGGAAQVEAGSVQYYTGGYLKMALDTSSVSSAVPAALAVTVSNDMYVLPYAFTVVPAPAPAISSVTAGTDGQGNPTATIMGSNLGSDPRILFDGARASLLNANQDGSLVVSPPPASGGYQAAVEALSSDGQTSSQALGSALPPMFTYGETGTPTFNVSPAVVVAGTDTMVQITGFNTNFIDGLTVVGFGSSDIVVRQVWVLGPGHLLANISVVPSAPATWTSVSVATGDQLATNSLTFEIMTANSGQMSLHTPIVDQATQLAGVPVGDTAAINTTGLPQNLSGWTLLIGNQQANFAPGAGGQILAVVPGGLLAGPTTVQLVSPAGAAIPQVLMQVNPPPPVITAADNISGVAVDASHPAHTGDTVTLIVSGLADPSNALPSAAGIQVNLGGINQAASAVMAYSSFSRSGPASTYLVQFVVPPNVPNGAQTPVTVTVNTEVSAPYSIAVQNQ